MRAKYYCSGVETMEDSVIAYLDGVEGRDADDDADSNQFNLAAPIGRLQIWVDNPNAENFFKKGKPENYAEVVLYSPAEITATFFILDNRAIMPGESSVYGGLLCCTRWRKRQWLIIVRQDLRHST